jgi:3-hydroxy-4-methylanthranilate adenylyltransferase
MRPQDLAQVLLHQSSAEPVWSNGKVTLTRSALHTATGQAVDALRREGVSEGSVVSVQLPVSTSWCAYVLAVWRIGAVCMLLDSRVTAYEVGRLHERWPPDFTVRPHGTGPMVSPLDQYAVSTCATGTGRTAPDEIALIQFSSGSTGLPKVVGRTAGELARELERYESIVGMPSRQDRLLLMCSAAHTWGFVGGVLWGLYQGMPVVLPPAVGGAAAVRAARSAQVTAIFGVPTTLALLASSVESPIPSLRVVVSAGEVLPAATIDLFRARLGVEVGQVFGMTELGVICADMTARRTGTVGQSTKGMRVRVREGNVEVAVERSPYLLDDGVERIRAGWLSTYDRGELDEAGVMTLRGRADSLAIVGGLKVDLMEVEAVVEDHPDVDSAIVFFTDMIEVRIRPKRISLTEREIIDWCSERLSLVKVPRRFHITAELPLTATGKKVRDLARVVSDHG